MLDYYKIAKTYLELGRPVLLEGGAGVGKTTMAMNLAKDFGLKFYAMSMTRQTTVNKIEGFISINGEYIGTQFREAVENGGLFLLDELDAADPNTILCLNTLENGFMSFPDKQVVPHPDFKLIATANPQDEHSVYTGRSKLDFATINRFRRLLIPPNEELEIALTSKTTHDVMQRARQLLKEHGSSSVLTYRDAVAFHEAIAHGIPEFAPHVLFKPNEMHLYDTLTSEVVEATEEVVAAERTWSDCHTIQDLVDHTQYLRSQEPSEAEFESAAAYYQHFENMTDTVQYSKPDSDLLSDI